MLSDIKTQACESLPCGAANLQKNKGMRKIKRYDWRLDVSLKGELEVCKDPRFLFTISFFRFYFCSGKTGEKVYLGSNKRYYFAKMERFHLSQH